MKTFDEKYPFITAWVQDGTVEIGYNDYDDTFSEMNARIEAWCSENGIDLRL